MRLGKKIILLLVGLEFTFSLHAQQSVSFVPRTNVKLSALAAIGIVNPAVEFRVDEKWSVQLEGMGVFAAENFLGTGYPLQMGRLSWRRDGIRKGCSGNSSWLRTWVGVLSV